MAKDRETYVEHYSFILPILKNMPNKKHLIKDQRYMVGRILKDKKTLTLCEKYKIKHDKKPYIEAEFAALMKHKQDMHNKGLTIYGNPLKR